jgi:acyl dehydratase
VLRFERAFTHEDVRAFAGLSCDQASHHLEEDAKGRRLVHGLLTATLPTKLGGDLEFLAQRMVFEFVRPVYTGELIRCEFTVTLKERERDRTRLAGTVLCTNPAGKVVMRAEVSGVQPDRPPEG